MKRHLLGGALAAAFLSILPAVAGALDIGSGDYTAPINGPVELSGDITLTTSGSADAALISRSPAEAITGTVRRLTIHTAETDGMVASMGSIRLNGPVDITTTGRKAIGLWAYGPGASIALDGPVNVATTGSYSHAVTVYDTGDAEVGLTIAGPLRVTTRGATAYGV